MRHWLIFVRLMVAHHGNRSLTIHENSVCRGRLFVISVIIIDETSADAEIIIASIRLSLGGLLLSLVF